MCKTCGLDQTKGCCQSCANVCHKGHELVVQNESTFFCDCGAGEGKETCKGLNYGFNDEKKN